MTKGELIFALAKGIELDVRERVVDLAGYAADNALVILADNWKTAALDDPDATKFNTRNICEDLALTIAVLQKVKSSLDGVDVSKLTPERVVAVRKTLAMKMDQGGTGWEVYVYRTEDDYQNTRSGRELVDSVSSLEEGIRLAESAEFEGAYRVTVVCREDSPDYEMGEVAYTRRNA